MLLQELPLELKLLVAGYLSIRDLARLLRVHSSLHNDVLISALHKEDVRATGGLALIHYAKRHIERGVLAMLAAGADVNRRSVWGRTALDEAVRRGHVSIVRLLLQESAPDLKGDSGKASPLAHAAQIEDDTIMELLLRHGADPNDKRSYPGYPDPLQKAIQSGNTASVALLLSYGAVPKWTTCLLHDVAQHNVPSGIVRLLAVELGLDIEEVCAGRTPLQEAIRSSSTDVVEALLNMGANANSNPFDGHPRLNQRGDRAPLLIATHGSLYKVESSLKQLGVHRKIAIDPKIVRLLLEHGADANAKTESGLTPLSGAVDRNSFDAVQMLLDHGAEIDVRLDNGRTVLHHAVQRGNCKIIKFLLERGADVDCRDMARETPIYGAITYNSARQSLYIVRRLLDSGASVTYKNRSWLTPLCVAAHFGKAAVMKLLIERGAAIDTRCRKRRTPLHWAADGPRHLTDHASAYRAVSLLINHGADPNLKDKYGRTPMHMAAASWSAAPTPRLMELLVRSGGELDVTDKKGKAPRKMIFFKKSTDRQERKIRQFFEDNGNNFDA